MRMKAFILAGGKGTRLGTLTAQLPKPLVPVAGKPIIEYHIELFKRYGITEIIILINHLGEQIQAALGDGSRWGVNIQYVTEPQPLGTAGAFQLIKKTLTEDFLVSYGDVLINMDLERLIETHTQHKQQNPTTIGTLVVHPNSHPHDSDLVDMAEDSRVVRFLPKPHADGERYRNLVNAALYILSPEICEYIPEAVASDFGKDIFPAVIAKNTHALYAYNTPEYLKDMGTPERLEEATRAVEDGTLERSLLSVKKPAIFIDRDGVINKEVDHVRRVEDFELLPGVREAIKAVNASHYYVVVITNQPAVAKGFCRYEDVLEVHKQLETELGQVGAHLDGLYFCPHHPEKGFAGENPEYKKECECRKPKTGMIRDAAAALNIDLENSWYIGDTTVDAKTAENAGVRFIGVNTGYACADGRFEVKIARIQPDLRSAVELILNDTQTPV